MQLKLGVSFLIVALLVLGVNTVVTRTVDGDLGVDADLRAFAPVMPKG